MAIISGVELLEPDLSIFFLSGFREILMGVEFLLNFWIEKPTTHYQNFYEILLKYNLVHVFIDLIESSRFQLLNTFKGNVTQMSPVILIVLPRKLK